MMVIGSFLAKFCPLVLEALRLTPNCQSEDSSGRPDGLEERGPTGFELGCCATPLSECWPKPFVFGGSSEAVVCGPLESDMAV